MLCLAYARGVNIFDLAENYPSVVNDGSAERHTQHGAIAPALGGSEATTNRAAEWHADRAAIVTPLDTSVD